MKHQISSASFCFFMMHLVSFLSAYCLPFFSEELKKPDFWMHLEFYVFMSLIVSICVLYFIFAKCMYKIERLAKDIIEKEETKKSVEKKK